MPKFSAAADRNRQIISQKIAPFLPGAGIVLEIASGSGQHIVQFAADHPHLQWQASDRDPQNLPSIRHYIANSGLSNALEPIVLDTNQTEIATNVYQTVICCNMIHISPWSSCENLFAKSAKALASENKLLLYGPFFFADRPTAPSNLEFDQYLKEQDPEWGVRKLEDLKILGEKHQLDLIDIISMPANNHLLVFHCA